MMNRKGFLAALAALFVARKLPKVEPVPQRVGLPPAAWQDVNALTLDKLEEAIGLAESWPVVKETTVFTYANG